MSKKHEYAKKVIQKFYDTQTGKISGSGNTGKPRNDKAGNVQHASRVDVSGKPA